MLENLIPIHPKLVHFPIALFVTALGFDFASLVFRKNRLHQTAVNIYVLAALITPWAVRTGMWEEERLHINHPLLDKHRFFALCTMWVGLISLPFLWLCKKEFEKYFRVLFIVCLLLVAGLVTMTGHFGGDMVYEYGVGVE